MKPYCMISNAKTFAFSAENPTGARAGGSKGGDCTKLSPTVTIRAGETVTLVDTDGPGMIQSIWFTGYVGHSFVIRMYWDNCEYPSVEAPISAFFGTAYDENFVDRDGKYAVLNSAQILVAPGRGLNCYWEMPFKKHCRITMENRGEKDQSLYYIITGCHCEVPDEIGYFHASYRQEHPVQKGRSYTIIDGIQGKGQFTHFPMMYTSKGGVRFEKEAHDNKGKTQTHGGNRRTERAAPQGICGAKENTRKEAA